MAVDIAFTDKLTKPAGEITRTGLPRLKSHPYSKAGNHQAVPFVTSGPIGRDSAGYSVLRAAGYCNGLLPADQCKEEIDANFKLKSLMAGYQPYYQGRSFFVPASSHFLPPEAGSYAVELRQKMAASCSGFDQDEAEYIGQKLNTKAAWTSPFGTTSDVAGGSLVGFPMLGEIIDMQRNLEAFTKAGAREITLPPNGRISFPKLTNGSSAYWVGEAASITQSIETTGSLLLEPHKCAVLVPMNNELMRYVGASAEALLRGDMAKVGALKVDLAFLEGTGGTQPTGITNYPTQSTWVSGVDKLISHTSVGDPSNSNLGYNFQPEDINLMMGKLPDAVDNATAWMVRTDWFAYILNRRADAVTAADGKGQFVFDMWRSIADGRAKDVSGSTVIKSRQINNNRVRGSATALTYALAGYFPDWIIGRHGVMEFMANPYGDQAFQNDQTVLRAIQIVDGGPRHAASFVICDQLAFN